MKPKCVITVKQLGDGRWCLKQYGKIWIFRNWMFYWDCRRTAINNLAEIKRIIARYSKTHDSIVKWL